MHLASYRHPELAHLLGVWQAERAAQLAVEWDAGPAATRHERFAALFALLLGLCQIDSLSGLGIMPREVRRQAHAMVDVLFPSEATS